MAKPAPACWREQLLVQVDETTVQAEGGIEGCEGVAVIAAQPDPLGAFPTELAQGGHFSSAVAQALFAALHARTGDDPLDRIPHQEHRQHADGMGLEAMADADQGVGAETAVGGGDVTGKPNTASLQSSREIGVVALGAVEKALPAPGAGFEQGPAPAVAESRGGKGECVVNVILLQETEIGIAASVELGMHPGGAGLLRADTQQKHAR